MFISEKYITGITYEIHPIKDVKDVYFNLKMKLQEESKPQLHPAAFKPASYNRAVNDKYDRLLKDGAKAIVAYNENKLPIGILSFISPKDKQTGYIMDFFIEKEYRGMKIGSELMDRVKILMKKDSKKAITVATNWKNVGARKFYKSAGFDEDVINYIMGI